jgi:hypothetical protein
MPAERGEGARGAIEDPRRRRSKRTNHHRLSGTRPAHRAGTAPDRLLTRERDTETAALHVERSVVGPTICRRSRPCAMRSHSPTQIVQIARTRWKMLRRFLIVLTLAATVGLAAGACNPSSTPTVPPASIAPSVQASPSMAPSESPSPSPS